MDAFTSIPFGGNPAGVVADASDLTDDIRQKIAREMNLSETAFVSPSKVADFRVQFFTLRFKVDLCGHTTIGTLLERLPRMWVLPRILSAEQAMEA